MNDIKSVRLVSAPEVNRGGKVVVCVDVEFSSGQIFSGIASGDDCDTNSLDSLINNAIENAKKRSEDYLTSYLEDTLIEIVKDATSEFQKQRLTDKVSSRELSEEQAQKFFGPTDEVKQKELNNLCDALGIGRIDCAERGWSMLETAAVNAALAKTAKRLENR